MSWANAIKERPKVSTATEAAARAFVNSFKITPEDIDWARLVALDFETYYDADYTLNKLSTSEYIRDPRFKAQMVGIKVGNKPRRVYHGAARIRAALKAISWETHSLVAHNTQFDAFILSHHYKIFPKRLYCTMSMARGLYSNEIGAGLDEVSKFHGGKGKVEGGLEPTKGVLNWPPALVKSAGIYCGNDVDECLWNFKIMVPKMPVDEMDLIDLTVRMFTDPVLKVNIPRVEAELKREIEERNRLMMVVRSMITVDDALIKTLRPAERILPDIERDLIIVKKVVGSDNRFADLLRKNGVEPPVKLSAAWMKLPNAQRTDEGKWGFAFAKDDQEFVNLPDTPELWSKDLNLNKKQSIVELAVRETVIRALVECRLAVKSTTNITRAERFLKAGTNGMSLPCGYAYARAHTLRWGGNNKMNMQNLTRGGELRQSIDAPDGHVLNVVDSGQIEARVNGWLWGQHDLLAAFKAADEGTGRDAYCLMGDTLYNRTITKADTTERFVGKVCVLGLGFQMGAPKLQMTLAKGALGGPPVFFTLSQCQAAVNAYRRKNYKIEAGWGICKEIIEDMAAGRSGSHMCLTWGKGFIQLPNGLTLKYPDLKKAMGDKGWEEWSYQAGRIRKKIYGGLLCENIVQALARIIVASQMLIISRKGHRIVMTTHDEAVTCNKKRLADIAQAFMLKAFRTAPAWCSDIPLNAEGGWATNYSK